jgi:hypothetical protein
MDMDEHDRDGIKPAFHSFYNLMKYKVTNILLVSSLYDAFILEEEGLLSDQISGEYQDLSLSSPPRVVRTESCEDALAELKRGHYDLIITMPRLVDMDPIKFGRMAKELQPKIPVILLVTDTADIPLHFKPGHHENIDKVFYFSGDSSLFFAIVKYVEDTINVVPDTKEGPARVLLLVEDSPRYYSMFLPILYREILIQRRALISEGLNEHEKLFRKKTRPKIILAETYEEAIVKYRVHRDAILGVITDVNYPMGGKHQEGAGFLLIMELDEGIPALLQSSRENNRERAEQLGLTFINKTSDTMLQSLRAFFKDCLGFGDFIFQMPDGAEIGKARDIAEFIEMAKIVPAETIRYHAGSNHFSNWFMARGEIDLALKLRPQKVSDFKDGEEMRQHLLLSIKESKRNKRMGVITNFSQQDFEFHETFTRLGGGSLGGKGRGLAFLFSLFNQTKIRERIPHCSVKVPDTLVICTDVFDNFIESNQLHMMINEGMSDEEIKRAFTQAEMPPGIKKSLAEYLAHIDEPLAVRSSSLLEDSYNQPFAGIYSTYMLPNNCNDDGTRVAQLCQAIKLVYASAFFKAARAYIQTTVHTSEEEKMAIVIQKLVGNMYSDRFYPAVSGLAQSYNFYPVAPLTRDGGIVSAALGLGSIVVDGGKVLSFSPTNPGVLPGFTTPDDMLKNSQNTFYALNMGETCYDLNQGEHVTILDLPIDKAAGDGTLEYVASTYDANDGMMRDGYQEGQPVVVSFSGILKYNMLPLVDVIKELLHMGARGMGGPVEMEFALSFNGYGKVPEFYVVQIRPLVTRKERGDVAISEKELESARLLTTKALGNGILQGIQDVVFIHPDDFDNTKTLELASDIGRINKGLDRAPYILIGPGRWGTRDRFLGIPVEWDQISAARAIIEVGLEGFYIDPSYGTHFFHNITSLGIPYFTMPYGKEGAKIDWDWLTSHKIHHAEGVVKHIRLEEPLDVKVDGRSGQGIVIESRLVNGNNHNG